jgi:hypothetical protein
VVRAALRARLGRAFERSAQWADEGQYQDGGGLRGFRLAPKGRGKVDVVLYAEVGTHHEVRDAFRGLVETVLGELGVVFVRHDL